MQGYLGLLRPAAGLEGPLILYACVIGLVQAGCCFPNHTHRTSLESDYPLTGLLTPKSTGLPSAVHQPLRQPNGTQCTMQSSVASEQDLMVGPTSAAAFKDLMQEKCSSLVYNTLLHVPGFQQHV